jgi:6-phosphogluconolactonase
MSVREIVVCADTNVLAHAAAQFVLGEIERKEAGRFLLALSGGSTPAALYDVIAQNPAAREILNSRCEIFFSDERPVGPDHPDSNFRLARTRLFEPLGLDNRIIHCMEGEASQLEVEGSRYTRLIRRLAGVEADELPRFDLTLLGMGADGHTASLFPDYDFKLPERDIIVTPYVASINSRRLSFSMSLINASRAALVLIAGGEKAQAVNKALDSSIQEDMLPVARVAAERTVWMLDLAAARLLNWTGKVLSL